MWEPQQLAVHLLIVDLSSLLLCLTKATFSKRSPEEISTCLIQISGCDNTSWSKKNKNAFHETQEEQSGEAPNNIPYSRAEQQWEKKFRISALPLHHPRLPREPTPAASTPRAESSSPSRLKTYRRHLYCFP